jgi:hypothetical protein
MFLLTGNVVESIALAASLISVIANLLAEVAASIELFHTLQAILMVLRILKESELGLSQCPHRLPPKDAVLES